MGFGHLKKQFPDTAWLLNVLSTLDNNHAIFHRKYLPPVKEEPAKPQSKVIDNSDRFFSGLPEKLIEQSQGKKGGGRRILPKEVRN